MKVDELRNYIKKDNVNLVQLARHYIYALKSNPTLLKNKKVKEVSEEFKTHLQPEELKTIEELDRKHLEKFKKMDEKRKQEPKIVEEPKQDLASDILKDLNNPKIIEVVKKSNNLLIPFLENSKIIDFTLKFNPKLKIGAIDSDKEKVKQLTELYAKNKNIVIQAGNFLNMNLNNNEFDLIICKSPIEVVGDNLYYFDYLFKILNVVKQGFNYYKGNPVNIVFICPIMDLSNKFNIIDLISNNKSLPFDKFSELYYKIAGKFVSPKEFKEPTPRIKQDFSLAFGGEIKGSLIGTDKGLGIYLFEFV